MIIALGLWIIVVRTLLGIPGTWQTFLLVLTGVALAVIGFLLRGEALARGTVRRARAERGATYPFVDSHTADAHEHKEGITSLN